MCPECAQGKPWNCTGWAINADDEMTDCETAKAPDHTNGSER